MRIDSRERGFHGGWLVWHAEQCAELKGVVWVDDECARYGKFHVPLRVIGNEVLIEPYQAKRILIIPDSKLVIINPVEGAETAGQASSAHSLKLPLTK